MKIISRIKNASLLLNFKLANLLLICIPSVISAQHFEFSSGLYRVGYEDGTDVDVFSDVYHHDPKGKYDLLTDMNNRDIVAAAPGWIRWIEDSHDEECYCCWENNNFVIIEHPNGEWSQYTHIQHNSATQAGIVLNQWVETGTVLGVEGSVGCSTEPHLHFELSRPDDPTHPFDTIGGFLNGHGEMLIPVIAGIQPNHSYMLDDEQLTAGPLDDVCPETIVVNASVPTGGFQVIRVNGNVTTTTTTPVILQNTSTAQYRAGQYVVLNPGFYARQGTAFSVIIKGCNEQN